MSNKGVIKTLTNKEKKITITSYGACLMNYSADRVCIYTWLMDLPTDKGNLET